MTKQKYRIYLIILGNIKDQNCDTEFAKYVNENNFEYWRYTPLNWIILTPITVSINMVNAEVAKAYRPTFITCLEININDVAGIFPTTLEMREEMQETKWSPFIWFHKIKKPSFKPKWEKVKQYPKPKQKTGK